MKMYLKLLALLVIVGLVTSCTKEPPENTFGVSPSATDVLAGSAVDYSISGTADFITFYSGIEGSRWEMYPEEKGVTVDISNSNVFSKVYNKQGEFTSTFVASSYGNWAEDEETVIKEFQITVTDKRTGIASFSIITGSILSGYKEWQGTINTDNNTVVVEVSAGTNVTNAIAQVLTDSEDAVVKVKGAVFENKKTKLDYSSPQTFKITAPDGSTANWTVTVVEV